MAGISRRALARRARGLRVAIIVDVRDQSQDPADWPWESAVSEETYREIEHFSKHYPALMSEMRRDVGELIEAGSMRRARELADATGEHFNHNRPPLYFTGDVDAPLVLVHLNPKQPNATSGRPAASAPFETFEDYFDVCRHFGARRYGPDSSRRHKSPFDHKQIRFLKPFELIDFVEEEGSDDRLRNLELAIDGKLQLELIPYGSNSFSGRGLTQELLQPHYDRLMSVITARRRAYVIFCGGVFERLMKPYVIGSPHRFRLRKSDGSSTRSEYRFANVRLPYRGQEIAAGIAYSWAQQGIPMCQYGEAIRERYGSP
jgi:hypothetical protein